MDRCFDGVENKPTPGPWSVVGGPIGSAQLNIVSTEYRATDLHHCVAWIPHGFDAMSQANAALVSAAPELLEVLEYVRGEYSILRQCFCDRDDEYDGEVCDCCRIRRVIGKATRMYLGDCCICSRPILPVRCSYVSGGHDAAPVADGKCCSWCYKNKVNPEATT